MVATGSQYATQAGIDILQAGGNAIDAAVAAAWALDVCEPGSAGLGGQSVLLIRLASEKIVVIDGHSRAPAAASLKTISKRDQRKGFRACTIPSTPAALGFTHRNYGDLPMAGVMEPAIKLAEDGYRITALQNRHMEHYLSDLQDSESAAGLFLKDGLPPPIGTVFRQPKKAAMLHRIVEHGIEDFYSGKIARMIAKDMKSNGGLITEEDLENCCDIKEQNAISVSYRDHEVLTTLPPSGGLQLLQALTILQQFEPNELTAYPEVWYGVVAEAIRSVFLERERWATHTRDSSIALYKCLLSPDRAKEIAVAIRAGVYTFEGGNGLEEPGETSHLCVVDNRGNAVSLTQSIQSSFGAKVANTKLGFLYNNYLYTCPRYPHPNQLKSRCIPRSNAAPTLVLKRSSLSTDQADNYPTGRYEPFLILGASGSRRITSALVQIISAVIDRGMTLIEALDMARIHALTNGTVRIEEPAATEPIMNHLKERFPKVETKPAHSYYMGGVQAIRFDEAGIMIGAADPRLEGTAAGLK